MAAREEFLCLAVRHPIDSGDPEITECSQAWVYETVVNDHLVKQRNNGRIDNIGASDY